MNKEYQCLIVDDEAVAQRIITGYLQDIPGFSVIATAKNALEAMQVLDKHRIDLMFLDIEMPKLKGLDFLSTLDNPPSVILTTAHREYALKGYELNVVDYLLKPISLERFIKALNHFKSSHRMSNAIEVPPPEKKKYIYVKSDRKTLKILQDEILFFEGMNNYIVIHVEDSKHIVYKSITDFLSELGQQFVRIHKSYVVNKKWVRGYNKEMVMVKKLELPVGKAFKDSLEDL